VHAKLKKRLIFLFRPPKQEFPKKMGGFETGTRLETCQKKNKRFWVQRGHHDFGETTYSQTAEHQKEISGLNIPRESFGRETPKACAVFNISSSLFRF
jgi:hypothetical protein